MFYKKTQIPEEGDIVLCTVKDVTRNSVFVVLDEYKSMEGMIHISEISPGRIRNIRDFVKEGKKIVCKVLRVNKDNYFQLSLRRVNQSQRINKNNEYKQELKAEKLIMTVGKKLQKSIEEMYNEIGDKIIYKYGSLSIGLQRISEDLSLLNEVKIPKKTEEALIEVIKEKIKPISVKITAKIKLQNTDPNGLDIIKGILLKLKKENIDITYISAPLYRIIITSNEYKKAELELKNLNEEFIELLRNTRTEGSIIREK